MPRCLAVLNFALLSSLTTFAVSPLVTDDAGTVEAGRLQLNSGWHFRGTDSDRLHSLLMNPVIGLNSRSEVGILLGYQWLNAPADTPDRDADGITDLVVGSKCQLWQSSDESFTFTVRLDLKLPTASEPRGLGTGQVDLGGFLLATRCWDRTCLDWNVGYAASDPSRNVFHDDLWFLGQAMRHQLTDRWTLIGEVFALLPSGGSEDSATVHLSGGGQFNVHEDLLISTLIGSSVGSNSPDLTGYIGFTWVF